MTKVFVDPVMKNSAMYRIADALTRYAPEDVEIVGEEHEADLVVIYAYGHRRLIKYRTGHLLERGKRYAIVQLAVRSTRNPGTEDWLPIWQQAEVVWSYYSLVKMLREDGESDIPEGTFYHAPLGVDTGVFKDYRRNRIYKAVVGDNRDESVNEVIRAAKGNVFHLGIGVSDVEVANGYCQSQFVSGLRRKEGFEMPVIEGLMCGARPVCYDKSHYREWFGDLVEYIAEEHPELVVKSLQELFSKPARVVTDSEKKFVASKFAWKPIIEGFWEKAL